MGGEHYPPYGGNPHPMGGEHYQGGQQQGIHPVGPTGSGLMPGQQQGTNPAGPIGCIISKLP